MKTDKYVIRPDGAEATLDRVERLAACYFPAKVTLQIRLLAEEIIAVIGPTFRLSAGRCWVSTDKTAFSLSIDCDAGVRGLDAETKKQLLDLSTVKGSRNIFGMIGKALEYLSSADIDAAALAGESIFYMSGMSATMSGYIWNPALVQRVLPPPAPMEPTTVSETKEELEMKIIEGIADDIKVSVQRSPSGPRLEITVLKKFTPEQVYDIEF